jgi:hypothetical protein
MNLQNNTFDISSDNLNIGEKTIVEIFVMVCMSM